LALGVDAAAHEGALAGFALAGEPSFCATIAVVGTGLDRVYPKSHLDLARRIVQSGCLVSEYPLGTPPLAANFPKRNRLIAGLSQATLVVEAALQSGSLITARLANDQGKDVFAIPGSIHAPQSRGCHLLIKQGAKLVEAAQDVLEEFQHSGFLSAPSPDSPNSPAASLAPWVDVGAATPSAAALLQDALGFDPVELDALQSRTGLDTAQLMAQLMALELAGLVARLPGGRFQRLSAP
jgi:DNA processing protein